MTDRSGTAPPWTEKDCDRCGARWHFTRLEPKPEPAEYVCPECAAYERGEAASQDQIEDLERQLEVALAFDEQSLFDEYSRLLSENGRLLRERNLARQERDILAAEMRKQRPAIGVVYDREAWDLAEKLKP